MGSKSARLEVARPVEQKSVTHHNVKQNARTTIRPVPHAVFIIIIIIIMNDIKRLKDQQRDIHPGFDGYIDCMTKALFTGLASFCLGNL